MFPCSLNTTATAVLPWVPARLGTGRWRSRQPRRPESSYLSGWGARRPRRLGGGACSGAPASLLLSDVRDGRRRDASGVRTLGAVTRQRDDVGGEQKHALVFFIRIWVTCGLKTIWISRVIGLTIRAWALKALSSYLSPIVAYI